MNARLVNAASNSDRASSFTYSKAQSNKSASGSNASDFSQLMMDSAAERPVAPNSSASATRMASQDSSTALQQKQDKRSQSTQARRTEDTSKKDKAEDNDRGETAAVTVPQANDRSPLTMLFGMPTAKFDGKVADGQEADLKASADGASVSQSAPGDDTASSEIDSSTSNRLPLAMLFGNLTAQFASRVIDGPQASSNPSANPASTAKSTISENSSSESLSMEAVGKESVKPLNISDDGVATPEDDGATPLSDTTSALKSAPNDVVSSELPTGGAAGRGSVKPLNGNDVTAVIGSSTPDRSLLKVSNGKSTAEGQKASSDVASSVESTASGDNSELLTGGAAPKNVNDVAPAKGKSDDERKLSPEVDSSAPDRSPLMMSFGMPTVQLNSKAPDSSPNIASATKNAISDSGSAELSTGSGTGKGSAPALRANSPASTTDDSKRKPTSGTDSLTADRAPLVMPFGLPATQLDSKVTEPPSNDNAASSVKSTLNDSGSSDISASGSTGKESVTTSHVNNLAFAMRVGDGELKSSSETNSSTPALETDSGDAPKSIFSPSLVPVTVEASSKSDFEQNSRDTNDSQQQPFVVDPALARTPATFDSAPPPSEPLASNATYAADDVGEAANSEPVRNVRMQLVSEDNKRVDVRLFDRGGELHVSVKSGDVNLAQDLQTHMHDLTSRLEKQDFQTEVWMPKVSEPSKTESGNTNGFSSDRENRSFSGNSDERRGGRQQQKPEWVESLES